ncbi:ATP-binding protein [Dendronalium sp. ChiSLP03b]|uniref:ATP-binding protein n=1 Tax=Dendronalium sp. ChiSLP03b TaxID=3075381 RepID=UPI002AD21EB3|nr:ATP-binding protein [Dendronalium sp. ChiSLP03b]MDZ8203540.1 ATP-binding protein [Dendronalium sp. ChiSLP03b]
MDFSAESKLNYTAPSSMIPKEQRLLGWQRFSATVTFEEALSLLNDLVLAERRRHLSEAEVLVIEGAWNDKEYEEIANNSTYSRNYLQRRVAPPLWDMLSKTIGNRERVGKKSLRYFLERVTKKYQSLEVLNEEKITANNLVQVTGSKIPDISKFYGRAEEIRHLKGLITEQRCVLLVGVAGIGKSALAAKLIAELSVESRPRFDCLVWKSVAHAPSVQELVADLIELIEPSESSLNSSSHAQAMISALIKQLQSRRCLLVLDTSEVLFQKHNLQERLEYRLLFRRLSEELYQSSILLTSRVFPDEMESLIATELPIDFLRIEGLDTDAAIQLLCSKGLTDQEKCDELIKTYRGNPSELKAVANRIHHFFAGSAEKFFENPTTLVSDQFQEMLNQVFSQQVLSKIQRQIMIYLAEELTLNSNSVNFAKLLTDMNSKQKELVSTLEIIKAIEGLEKDSLVESSKDPITKEISFTLQPVIKKYIKTDPLGLVHTSHASTTIAIAS